MNFLTIACPNCRIEYKMMVNQAPNTEYSTVKCVEQFNRRIERKYYTDENTKATYLYVCFCCDKLLKYSETAIATPDILINLFSHLQPPTSIDNAIIDCYKSVTATGGRTRVLSLKNMSQE